MRKARWVYYLSIVSGIFLLLACFTSCEKTEYDLLDPASAGVWKQYKSGSSGIPGNLVWDIEPENDKLWVSFLGKGVGVYNNGSWTIYNESNSGILNDYIKDLELTPNGDMLMGTADGLSMRTSAGSWLFYQDASVSSMDINTVKYTSAGDIWLGTDGEGFYVDFGSGFFHFKFPGCEYINAIEEDSHGDVWLGTSLGLWRYDGSSIALTITSANGLPEDEVSTLFLDSKNKLWVGTDGGETVTWISSNGIIHQFSLRNGGANYIMDIYEDRKGDLWFATWYDGLIKYDGVVPQIFKEYNTFLNKPGDLIENYVNCIGEDNKGNMWFGMFHNGLVKYSLPLE